MNMKIWDLGRDNWQLVTPISACLSLLKLQSLVTCERTRTRKSVPKPPTPPQKPRTPPMMALTSRQYPSSSKAVCCQRVEIWSLRQFYYVGFSQSKISVKSMEFYK